MNRLSKISVFALAALLMLGLWSFKSKKEKETVVQITTKFGDIKLKLYNETPLHRDNFLKLANEEYFDSLLFHRVMKNFMIQGADPDSKNAPQGKQLGNGGPGYQLEAEFVSGLYHKKGALAAAREPDNVNPEKKSAGSQFYIVQGQVWDSAQLEMFEKRFVEQFRSVEFNKYMSLPENADLKRQYMQAMQSGDRLTSSDIMNKTNPVIDKIMEKYTFTDEQIELYTTVGGTPFLDFNYTVFGEMIEGWEVLDAIANVPVDRSNRPLEDLVMSVKIIK
jgi:cyclophilin family peptidyl-prolyl cis-trans isomerase